MNKHKFYGYLILNRVAQQGTWMGIEMDCVRDLACIVSYKEKHLML